MTQRFWGKLGLPVAMGLIMGPMVLWMIHGAATGNGLSGWALLAFVGAHLVVVGVILGAGIVAARLAPGLRHRRHRPSLGHVGLMGASAVASASLVHLIHGGM